VAIVASPTLGFLGGVAVIVAIYRIFFYRRLGRIIPVFKHLQRASAAYMAFSHGRNDAQKPMGMLALAIALHFGARDVSVPIWIVVSCALVAAVGTAYGGWRIIRTLGLRITVLDPVQGFAAETAAATGDSGRFGAGHPDQHDARHHLVGRGRRRGTPHLGGPLGDRRPPVGGVSPGPVAPYRGCH
jgi:PiT family inorganic phosphate transporter